jgi:hypothetical protein
VEPDEIASRLAEGLTELGKGIAWAGFWIGLGIALNPAFVERLF